MHSSTRSAVPGSHFHRKPASVVGSLISLPGSRLLRRPALIAAAIALAMVGMFTGFVAPPRAAAANLAFPDLPVGFAKVQLANGLHNPTAIAFAPNGDIYIAQQKGPILLYRGGVVQPTPVITISSDTGTETGRPRHRPRPQLRHQRLHVRRLHDPRRASPSSRASR